MIGNHHCDSECYNAECNWDALDCGCATNCSTADYGSCKPECLRPDCGYDRMPGFKSCPDAIQQKETLGLHLLSKNFEVNYSYEAFCAANTPTCVKSLWIESYSTCIPECKSSYYCGGSFGNCPQICPAHCTACFENDCYGCETGYILFYTTCLKACPNWFTPHPLVPEICYYNSSISLPTSEAFYYVSNRTDSDNLGTPVEPFTSISFALAAAYTNSATIYILQGTHILSANLGTQYLHIWLQDSFYDNIQYDFTPTITITALLCSIETHPDCVSGAAPTLIFDNLNPVSLRVRGSMIIQGVNISGRTSLTSDCMSDLCVYCPYVEFSDGVWLDDRQNPIANFSAQSTCDVFHSHSLFLIYSGSALTLTNVNISDFRQQFSSLISFSNANLTLNNVTFANNMANDAVLYQSGANLASNVQMRNGSVERLNNGYEYRYNYAYSGFIAFSSVFAVEIDSVLFSFNNMGLSGALMQISDFITFKVSNCEFEYNLGKLIAITSAISIPRVLDNNNNLIYFNITHLSILNSTFNWNSGNSLISVMLSGDIQNVLMRNCTFEENLSLSSGLISVTSRAFPNQYESAGSSLGVISLNKRYRVLFPPTWLEISSLSFLSCSVYGDGLIFLQNMVNVNISSLEFVSNGDIGPNQIVNEITLSHFGSNPLIYMSQTRVHINMLSCSSLIYASSLSGFILSKSNFQSNICKSGSGGVVSINIVGIVQITNCNFHMTTSSSVGLGTALDLSASGLITVTHLTVLNCLNMASNGNGIVRLESAKDVMHITDSIFSFNSFSSGGALHCLGSFNISNSKFISNTSSGTTAAGLVYEPLPNAPILIAFSLLFVNNTSVIGGALSLHDHSVVSTPIQLLIDSSAFTSNTGVRLGACVYIAQTVKVSTSSFIANSDFENNYSGAACFNSAFQGGILTIDNCLFRNNTGLSHSVVYHSSPTSKSGIQSKLVWQNSVIEYNKAQYNIGIHNSQAETRNLTYQFNIGEGLTLEFGTLIETGSVFRNNSANMISSLSLLLFSSAHFINTKFIGERNVLAPAIYIGVNSFINFTACDFIENESAFGCALFSDEFSVVYIHSCRFLRNKSATFGVAIVFFTESEAIVHMIINTTFAENEGNSGTVRLIMSNAQFINCSFYGNKAISYPGLLSYLSILTVIGCTFHDQYADKGNFIAAPSESQVTIIGSVFYNGVASTRGVAVLAGASSVVISQCSFSHFVAPTGTAVYISSYSSFSITQSEFTDLNATAESGGAVYAMDSVGIISNTSFEGFLNGAIVGERISITVKSTSISGKFQLAGSSQYGAAIFCLDCQQISFLNSACSNLQADYGACLYLKMIYFEGLFTIQNSTFHSNAGMSTGAVHIDDGDAQFTASHFINNTVAESSGDGGGLYLACYGGVNGCSVNITDCVFAHNTVLHNGGGVVWTRSQPIIINTTFSSNTAQYGSDVASFPIKLVLTSTILSELTNVASGQGTNSPLSVSLIDHYNQVVSTDNSSTANLIPTVQTETTVTGSTRVVATSGVFVFTSFEITHTPNSTTNITIQTNGIKEKSNLDGVISSEITIPVTLRACMAGESLISNMCYPCPEGKYSLDPSGACLDCPTGAVCYGKALVVPSPGYWRSSFNNAKFWKCPNTNSCLGSSTELTNLSPTGQCAIGYFGNMCNGCLSGYLRSSRASCTKCPSQVLNFLEIIGISLLVILAVVFIIKMSLMSAQKARSHFSIYLKIFLNYLHLVAVTASFNLSWPSSVLQLFKVQGNAGSVSDQVFSFDCFINTGTEDNQQTVVNAKIIAFACIPPFIFAASALIWIIISLFRCSFDSFRVKLINSVVILFFIAHPTIVKNMFDVFNCTEINPGEQWLTSFLNIRCWDSEHRKYAMIVALPSIILWGVGCPAIVLISLILSRRRLEDISLKIQFGFVYSGYQIDRPYWEFVILYRKMLLITFSVFLSTISVSIQALCVLLVMLISLLLQYRFAPFQAEVFNKLELRSILVSVTTIYCGLFYMAEGIDSNTEIFLFAVIIAINAYFVSYWFLNTIRAGCTLFKAFIKRFPRIARYIFPRSNAVSSVSPEEQNLDARAKGSDFTGKIQMGGLYSDDQSLPFDAQRSLINSDIMPPPNSIYDDQIQSIGVLIIHQ